MKYFVAKLFVRMENPKDSIPKSQFHFFEQAELKSQEYDLPNDGYLMNCISAETWTVMQPRGVPWRGAREKTDNLLFALIDLCTQMGDIVMDLTASTGTFSSNYSAFFEDSFRCEIDCVFFYVVVGASLKACKVLYKHLVALEGDPTIVE